MSMEKLAMVIGKVVIAFALSTVLAMFVLGCFKIVYDVMSAVPLYYINVAVGSVCALIVFREMFKGKS